VSVDHWRAGLRALETIKHTAQTVPVASDTGRAAFDVGYESTSRFTREYKRLFGQPPMHDVKARRFTS
jgi:AraC-like DNA-binding protein